jgi:hypothetical protein
VRLPSPSATVSLARLLLLVAAAGCGHSDPFATDPPDPLGPSSSEVPRQLTFNAGDDRSPTVTGSAAAYSRRVPGAPHGAACIAILPAEGGTLTAEFCPPEPSAADTFVSNWMEPALSPDGTRLAYVWRRSAPVSYLGAWSHDLAVAAADAPGTPIMTRSLVLHLADGRFANTAMELRWTDDTTVRYLAAFESIYKVKDGGASRYTDTTLLPYVLMEMNARTSASRAVPGADTVSAYADDGAGGTWVARGGVRLVHLGADGTPTPAPDLPFAPTDLDLLDGLLVVAGGLAQIAFGDPAVGSWQLLDAPGPVFRITRGPDRSVVAEVERGEVPFGAPANLWLLPVPR